MNKLKLNLDKHSVIRLTSDEVIAVEGGGPTRSNNRTGTCRYSRNHPQYATCQDADGNTFQCVIGCVASGN